MPDPSLSSLYVVSGLPSMLFSYLSTTSLLLSVQCPHLYWVVGHILLIVPVLGCESSIQSCSSYRLSCLEVTRGLGENGTNC